MIQPIFLCSSLRTFIDVDNKVLAEQIYALKDAKQFTDEKHTFNEDSDYPDTAECNELIEQIDKFIQENVHSKYKTWTKWSHILEPREQTMLHTHASRDIPIEQISWVYYVDVPKNSGDLGFVLNVGKKSVHQDIQPETGMLLIFPDWIPHFTYKNNSDKARISVSGNSAPAPEDIQACFDNPENLYNIVGIAND